MNVPIHTFIDNGHGELCPVVLFQPYWLAYSHEVFHMLSEDHAWYSPVLFENL